MTSLLPAAIFAALLALPAAAAAEGFLVDLTRGEAVRAIGGTTVGDLPVGGSGYIPTGFYGWCLEGRQLYVPLETQVVGLDSYDAFLELTVLEGGQVSLESLEIEFYPGDFDYHLHFPTCSDLVAAGAISSPEGYLVQSIDGATSLSAWIAGEPAERRPQLPKL